VFNTLAKISIHAVVNKLNLVVYLKISLSSSYNRIVFYYCFVQVNIAIRLWQVNIIYLFWY